MQVKLGMIQINHLLLGLISIKYERIQFTASIASWRR